MTKGRPKGLGRVFTLTSEYPNIKIQASTVNHVIMKTINLDVRFWIEKQEGQDTEKTIRKLFKECKKTLTFQSGGFYDVEKIISIENTPDDIRLAADRMFILFEFTLFPKHHSNDYIHTSNFLNSLGDMIYINVFKDKDFITKSKNQLTNV